MFKTALGRVRWIGIAEGISFLVLLFIAMPLKYFLDYPEVVSVVGAIHGVLFILYLAAIANVTFVDRWSLLRIAGAVIAAFLPFGTFVLDSRIRKKQ